MNFKNLFKRNTRPKVDYPITLAFTAEDGTEYWEFSDPLNIPADRGNNVLTYFKELELGVTRADLKVYLEAIRKVLTPMPGKGINLGTISILTQQLEQKCDMQVEVDVLWKIASVVYFDASENPGGYDYDYAKKKIEKWKNDFTIDVFFSISRMFKYMPHSKLSEENIKTFSTLAAEIKAIHEQGLGEILKMQSSRDSGKG